MRMQIVDTQLDAAQIVPQARNNRERITPKNLPKANAGVVGLLEYSLISEACLSPTGSDTVTAHSLNNRIQDLLHSYS